MRYNLRKSIQYIILWRITNQPLLYVDLIYCCIFFWCPAGGELRQLGKNELNANKIEPTLTGENSLLWRNVHILTSTISITIPSLTDYD